VSRRRDTSDATGPACANTCGPTSFAITTLLDNGSNRKYVDIVNFPVELRRAKGDVGRARRDLASTEANRDKLICDAYAKGALSVLQIAENVGLTRQRVSEIIAGAGIAFRPSLHDAMVTVLSEKRRGTWMHSADLADAIYERGLYVRRDGGKAPAHQIRSRARQRKYRDLFEASTDGSGRLRLR